MTLKVTIIRRKYGCGYYHYVTDGHGKYLNIDANGVKAWTAYRFYATSFPSDIYPDKASVLASLGPVEAPRSWATTEQAIPK